MRNDANATPPVRKLTGIAGNPGAAGRSRHNTAPPTAPISNAAICTKEPLVTSSRAAAISARAARGRSGQRFRAILHTACATTATATSFKPCSTASVVGPSRCGAKSAKANITSAEGKVKPAHAANAPPQPARRSVPAKYGDVLLYPFQRGDLIKQA